MFHSVQDADMFWDFLSLRPEATHQVSFLFSDRGIPDGYRHMNGYGSHTFKLVNKDCEAVYCKFHYKVIVFNLLICISCCGLCISQTDQGIKNCPVDKAATLAGTNPDYGIQDLYDAIASGNPVGPHNCNGHLVLLPCNIAYLDNVHSSNDV